MAEAKRVRSLDVVRHEWACARVGLRHWAVINWKRVIPALVGATVAGGWGAIQEAAKAGAVNVEALKSAGVWGLGGFGGVSALWMLWSFVRAPAAVAIMLDDKFKEATRKEGEALVKLAEASSVSAKSVAKCQLVGPREVVTDPEMASQLAVMCMFEMRGAAQETQPNGSQFRQVVRVSSSGERAIALVLKAPIRPNAFGVTELRGKWWMPDGTCRETLELQPGDKGGEVIAALYIPPPLTGPNVMGEHLAIRDVHRTPETWTALRSREWTPV